MGMVSTSWDDCMMTIRWEQMKELRAWSYGKQQTKGDVENNYTDKMHSKESDGCRHRILCLKDSNPVFEGLLFALNPKYYMLNSSVAC